MEMTGQQRIAAVPQRVWDVLLDPAVLQECIPGCQSLEKDGDRMRAAVVIKIGPIGAKFSGAISLTEQDPPRSCRIIGEGQGGNAGFAKGEAKVKLEDQGGTTVLSYTVSAQVSGKLAQVGGALIDATAKRLAANFFKRFGEIVERPETESVATTPSVDESSRVTAHSPGATPAPVADMPLTKNAGAPMTWILAVALAAIVGFLVGRGQGGGSDWMGIAIGLLIMLVAVAGFFVGKGTATPFLVLDAAQVSHLIDGHDR